MRRLHPNGQYCLADHLLKTFVNLGYWVTPETKILDYGCGEGGLVYELRSLGYEAYGFDIHERVNYRDPEDRRFFGFMHNLVKDTSNYVIEPDALSLPWRDDTFDIVISTSVIEHVLDLPRMMAEIARVLKPSGFSWHLYPKKSIPIEPHIYVPLASRFQNWWYFYFWALLGVRNEFQEANKMSARETADNNVLYCRTGLRYYSQDDLVAICGQHFRSVQFVDWLFYCTDRPSDFRLNRRRALTDQYPLRALARTCKLGAVVTALKVISTEANSDLTGNKPSSLPERD